MGVGEAEEAGDDECYPEADDEDDADADDEEYGCGREEAAVEEEDGDFDERERAVRLNFETTQGPWFM